MSFKIIIYFLKQVQQVNKTRSQILFIFVY